MRILIASDSFKGTLTSTAIAEALAGPLRAAGHTVTCMPLADGGDGTVEAVAACGFQTSSAEVTGPLGAPVTAAWAHRGDVAVIEMAQASGIALLDPDPHTALAATTAGTGELIAHALDAGARRIVLGVGGSATTDGGAGMLTALGARLLDAAGQPIPPGGQGLEVLDTVDLSGLDARLGQTACLQLAFDVDNPLLGPRGAAAVYGPQKGAGPAEVARLDAALARFAARLTAAPLTADPLTADPLTAGSPAADRRQVPAAAAEAPGAGAAGGMGYAALAVLGAEPVPGIDFIMELTGFREALAEADLVITGEGRIDEQTLAGKGPGAVLRAAGAAGLHRLVVCGSSALSTAQLAAFDEAAAGAAAQAPAEAPVGPGRADNRDDAGSEPPPRARIHALTDVAPVEVCLADPAGVLARLAAELPAAITALEGS